MIVTKNLRVLVVDDTIVYRKAVSDIIEEIPGVELAGVAHNGKIALARHRSSCRIAKKSPRHRRCHAVDLDRRGQ